MAKAKGFTFFENYYECISDPENGLTDEERGACYNAIITYIFSGEVLPLKGAVKAIFTALRPSLDVSRNRSASGSAVKNIPEEDCEDNESESKEIQTEDEGKTNVNQTGIKSKTNVNQTGIKSKTNGNQTEIKSKTNGNQTEIKSEKLTFLEEIETRNKKLETEIEKLCKKEGMEEGEEIKREEGAIRNRRPTYEEIMRRKGCSSIFQKSLWKFIQFCILNKKTPTNEKIETIIDILMGTYPDDRLRCESLDECVSQGYFDVRERSLYQRDKWS